MTSNLWCAIIWNFGIQLPISVRYLVGPLPEVFCHLDILLRNVVAMHVMFYLDAIIVVKYIFTFYTKNPTAGTKIMVVQASLRDPRRAIGLAFLANLRNTMPRCT